jgi:phosphopantothenoylcysteine decarboxylase/phosphopantothenate--cysteine ligase
VRNGELASGLTGDGRMAEPEEIMEWLTFFFKDKNQLLGKKVLITAGPTYEAIDPVRFLGNASSGKMGIALARELTIRGADVTLVLGPSTEEVNGNINLIRVKSAEDMHAACLQHFEKADWAIMSAAVADYTPARKEEKKIKKEGEIFNLELIRTPDILKKLGELKKDNQCLVGFALETHNEKENALQKLRSKNADLIVLNSLNDSGAGFGHDTNKITIFDKKGGEFYFDTKAKSAVASDIINTIIKYTHE